MKPKSSKYITDFRKNRKTQHALLNMSETWRSKLNCGNKTGVLIMSFSKAFDTIYQNLLLPRLKTSVLLLEAIVQTGTRKQKFQHFQRLEQNHYWG